MELAIGGQRVPAGTHAVIELPVTRLYTHAPVTMPVHVVHGRRPGPRLFLTAAIHGDELNGVEIIRRLLRSHSLRGLRGQLFAIPVVNVHGFIHHSRYLPDRRDLNRSFPGSDRGSLAARLAHLVMTEVVARCTHGIDLHTGSMHRSNLPQIRADLGHEETRRLAHAFGVPVLLDDTSRDGSLRQAAAELDIPTLLYEAGEALRFDEVSIRAGVRGIEHVMRELGMLAPRRTRRVAAVDPVVARASSWVRAPASGILNASVAPGARVHRGDPLGTISDPYGERETTVSAPHGGIVICRSNLPLANEGDALFRVARFDAADEVVERLEAFHETHLPEAYDEDLT